IRVGCTACHRGPTLPPTDRRWRVFPAREEVLEAKPSVRKTACPPTRRRSPTEVSRLGPAPQLIEQRGDHRMTQRSAGGPVAGRALSGRLREAEAALFFPQFLDLVLPRPVETAAFDEADDAVELAGVEIRAVAAADVDDRSREPREIQTVHDLSARDALAV